MEAQRIPRQPPRPRQNWVRCPQALHEAVRAGLVFLNPDGSVALAASDSVWGRRHALNLAIWGPEHGRRGAPELLDPEEAARISAERPAWCKRILAELVELREWTDRAPKEMQFQQRRAAAHAMP